MSVRSSSYCAAEDVLLCQVYLEISQDPVVGRYQSQDQFWSRVEEAYNKNKPENWTPRNKRSVGSRMSTITSEVKKLNGCVRQIENMNPSGASNHDIVSILLLKHYFYITSTNTIFNFVFKFICS